MDLEREVRAEYYRQLASSDAPFDHFNMSDEQLMKLQLEIIRNYTTLYGSSALDRGHLNGDVLRHPLLRVVVVSIFVVVMVVGVLSNAAVLYAVTTIRRARTVASALIGNLAASDLWHCAFCLPIQLHYQLTDRWAFGEVMCRALFASFAIPLYSSSLSIFPSTVHISLHLFYYYYHHYYYYYYYSSSLSIVWIAVDRYRLIICPLKRRWSASVAAFMITTSIFISVIISIPVSLSDLRHR